MIKSILISLVILLILLIIYNELNILAILIGIGIAVYFVNSDNLDNLNYQNNYGGYDYCQIKTLDDVSRKLRTPRGYQTEALCRAAFNCFIEHGSIQNIQDELFPEIKAYENPETSWCFVPSRNNSKVPAIDNENRPIYMDIDGYNRQLRVGFEYQGPHHYRSIAAEFPEYLNRISKDAVKKSQAKKHNIALIIIHEQIPMHFRETSSERIRNDEIYRRYVKSRLYDLGLLKKEYLPTIKNEYIPFINEPLPDNKPFDLVNIPVEKKAVVETTDKERKVRW